MLWSARRNGGGHKFESGACCKNTIDFSKDKKIFLRSISEKIYVEVTVKIKLTGGKLLQNEL